MPPYDVWQIRRESGARRRVCNVTRKCDQMSGQLGEPEAPGGDQQSDQHFPVSQKAATDDGEDSWNTGDRELPDGASLQGVSRQAAIVLPDDFPPPKPVRPRFVTCGEPSADLSSVGGSSASPGVLAD